VAGGRRRPFALHRPVLSEGLRRRVRTHHRPGDGGAVKGGQATNSPWNTPPPAVAGRIYHDTDYNYWASYNSATRAGGKLSRYQFRDKRDFFAETYATYYETAPADPGRLVRAWNAKVYEWFRANVDRGQETQAPP
jgi:hypothetical protein